MQNITILNSHNQRLPVFLYEKSVLHHLTTLAMVYLNVPWLAMLYEICAMIFSFDLRWFHGLYSSYVTFRYLCTDSYF